MMFSFDEHRKMSYRSVFGVRGGEDCRVIQACFESFCFTIMLLLLLFHRCTLTDSQFKAASEAVSAYFILHKTTTVKTNSSRRIQCT